MQLRWPAKDVLKEPTCLPCNSSVDLADVPPGSSRGSHTPTVALALIDQRHRRRKVPVASIVGHPCKVGIRPLTAVPWVEFGPSQPESVDNGTVKDRLEALGYAE